jgi:hypothetical protein
MRGNLACDQNVGSPRVTARSVGYTHVSSEFALASGEEPAPTRKTCKSMAHLTARAAWGGAKKMLARPQVP